MMGDKLLGEYPQIDYLCIGEGESMVVEFLDNFGKESLYNIDNLAYRKDGKVFSNKLHGAENLETLPPFNWDFFSKYELVQKHGIMHIHATRGLPIQLLLLRK